MTRQLFVLLGLVLVMGLWLTGCAKDNGPTGNTPSTADKADIASAIAVEQLLTSDQSYLNDGAVQLLKADTLIFPWAWGRWIDTSTVTRGVTYQTVNDTTVLATVTTSYSGTFWLRGSFALRGAHQTFLKPFSESFTRVATFVRHTNPQNPNIKWRLAAVSPVKGGTASPGFSITGVSFVTPTDSVSITDPNNTYLWVGRAFAGGGVPTLNLADSSNVCKIYVKVVSSSTDSDFVTLHHPYWFLGGWHFRQPMVLISSVDNLDGTFTRVYVRPWHVALSGRHHVMVSVISRGSIMDNVAPFKSQVWGVPLIVN